MRTLMGRGVLGCLGVLKNEAGKKVCCLVM